MAHARVERRSHVRALVGLVGSAAAAGVAWADDQPQAVARLQRAHPGARADGAPGVLTRVYGAPMTAAATPRLAAEAWLAEHGPVLGGKGPSLAERWATTTTSGKTVFAYEQRIDGLPVPGSRARIVVAPLARPTVVYAAARVWPHGDADLPEPRVAAGAAAAALAGDPRTAGAAEWDAPSLVAYCGEDLSRPPSPSWRCTGRRFDGRPFVGYVDAVSGAVLAVHDLTVHAGPDAPVQGRVRGWVLPGLTPYWGSTPTPCPTDPVQRPMADVEVRVVEPEPPTPIVGYTDAAGLVTLQVEARTNVRLEARLRGPWWETTDCTDGGFSCFPSREASVRSRPVRSPNTAALDFALPRTEPERERAIAQMNAHALVSQAFRHMEALGALGPTPPFLRVWIGHDFVPPCNALYDLTLVGMRIPNAVEGCPNMAYASIVTHEWGHYFAHAILGFSVELEGDRTFHEGFADSVSVLVHDSPLIGVNGSGQCGSAFRDLSDPRCVYPGCPGTNGGRCDAAGFPGVYDRAEVLGGVWWDLRGQLGLGAARQLHADWALLTVGFNDPPPECGTLPQAAGPETLVEVAVADDDDGDLGNGVPHESGICAAFNANGITPPAGVTLCGESGPGPCAADCDTSTGAGVLDLLDFVCFVERFGAADPSACDCDTSTGAQRCDLFDILCFQSAFQAGCR